MARPAETYRGARRNAWRAEGCPPWNTFKLSGFSWKTSFDDKLIMPRPFIARGWDYYKGDRAKFLSVKDNWLEGKKAYRRLKGGVV